MFMQTMLRPELIAQVGCGSIWSPRSGPWLQESISVMPVQLANPSTWTCLSCPPFKIVHLSSCSCCCYMFRVITACWFFIISMNAVRGTKANRQNTFYARASGCDDLSDLPKVHYVTLPFRLDGRIQMLDHPYLKPKELDSLTEVVYCAGVKFILYHFMVGVGTCISDGGN